MNPKSIVSLFKTAGFKIEMFGERLAVSPAELLTDEHRNMIRLHKSELLKYLHEQTNNDEQACMNARHYLYPEPCVSDLERETLKKIFRQTTSTGSHLHRCTDAEQAERFNNFLMRNLPENFASGVIRDCEINTFNCKDDGRY
ncbi:MAG: hypothetical protein QGG03_09780 [SAR324 cluster bacterium]|jgi:hypothetical protein|nr:hypothetical protein [SAR324 cluster bacterium]